ncbi:hypothetical protein NEPAR06_1771 [Nematocida parisii]|nr:hypothetical protein NEPAR07_0561 [Nematocida parisii]KAI5155375.1 hypothetical protein NEPAR06_1771 [Nematocida parisii]KAI5156265.1 hypothetical protein NEPAR05_0426 [Nematocida parisii]
MHAVTIVDLSKKEVEIKKKEVKKKRRIVDVYDITDPFYQEDEEVTTFECRYENFFCLSGDAPAEKKKEAEGESEEKTKKDKKETARERYAKQKQDRLEEYSEVPSDQKAKALKELAVLELLTAQEPAAKDLVDAIMGLYPNENKEEIKNIIEKVLSKEGMEGIFAEAEKTKKELSNEIQPEILKRVKKNEVTDAQEIQFDNELLDLLVRYTDVEYLIFYIKLFISGKKRILEHKVKKNAVIALQELFPAECRSSSLGKKIAMHVIRKKKPDQAKESYSEGNADVHSNTEEEALPKQTEAPENTNKTDEPVALKKPGPIKSTDDAEILKEEKLDSSVVLSENQEKDLPKEENITESDLNTKEPEPNTDIKKDNIDKFDEGTINPSKLIDVVKKPVEKKGRQAKTRKAANLKVNSSGKRKPPALEPAAQEAEPSPLSISENTSAPAPSAEIDSTIDLSNKKTSKRQITRNISKPRKGRVVKEKAAPARASKRQKKNLLPESVDIDTLHEDDSTGQKDAKKSKKNQKESKDTDNNSEEFVSSDMDTIVV